MIVLPYTADLYVCAIKKSSGRPVFSTLCSVPVVTEIKTLYFTKKFLDLILVLTFSLKRKLSLINLTYILLLNQFKHF